MSSPKSSADQKIVAQALKGIEVNYLMASIRSPADSRVFNDKTVRWEASEQYRANCEKYVAKEIPGATSIKVVAPVMTDEIAATRQDASVPINSITARIPRSASFGPAAIAYTLDGVQYLCVHGVELNPYPQAFMGISTTLFLDESLGMANTTPVKDAIGINVKGAVKSTICTYYTERQIGLDDKIMGAAISPLVLVDIYDALKPHKLNLSLINFAAYKSADAELCQQILDWGTDAASFRIKDDPVPNMTGLFSFLEGFAESLWIPMILSYKEEIEAEILKSKTKDIGDKYLYNRSREDPAQNKIGIALHAIELYKQLIYDEKHFDDFEPTNDHHDPSYKDHVDADEAYHKPAREKWEDMAAFFHCIPDIRFDNPV